MNVKVGMNYISKSGQNSDGFHRSGYRALAVRVDLHSEARINSAYFAEAASERSASEAGLG